MKNILFLLGILLGPPIYCQTQSVSEVLTHLVAPLDKTEITSNFLWDKGTNGFAEPAIFDGIIRDSVYLQPLTFGFLYVQARNSFVGTGLNPLPHPDVYMDYVNRYVGTDTIPLAALALDYNRINDYVLDSNLFTLQNEQLFDVPSRTQSPYWRDTFCAFVPLQSNAWHSTVHFVFPIDLNWSNLNLTSPIYSIDPGDGLGYRTLTPNQTLTVYYSEGGAKIVCTRITCGGLTLETQSLVFVAETLAQERGDGPNYSVDDPEAILSIPGGGGDLRIFYGSPCNSLLKPFIIVEGFELTDNPEGFTNRLRDLLRKPDVITGTSLPLGEWLYAQGYDIVWVNLSNIQGSIQDNAEIVKAAVQAVNNIKAANGSSEPNMIMGVSAGGIITKYMLVKTNSAPFDHQCEKFFSYDVPLRGANIPVSVQCLLHHVNHIASENGQDLLAANPLAALAFNALTGPFAQQTLLYRFYYEAGTDTWILGSQEHDDFMVEIDALGAIPIRHIALSNGSTDNTTRANISPGSLMFNVNTSGTHWTLMIVPPLIIIPTFIEVELNANGYALSNTVGTPVYDGNLTIKADGITIKQFPLYVENGSDQAYDTAPGGSSTLALSALDGLNGLPIDDVRIPWIPANDNWVSMSNLSVTTSASHYCFIPTRSAVSIGDGVGINGTFTCGQGNSSRCTMNTLPTPLPPDYGVSVPEVNQDHVFLDARIGDVIVDELDAANLVPDGLIPSNLATYYNAGLLVQSGIPTINISTANGKLSVNNTGKVAFATANEPVSPFGLFLPCLVFALNSEHIV